jgi:hypothetical protein
MGVCPFAFFFLADLLSGWPSFGIFFTPQISIARPCKEYPFLNVMDL